ncbi:MAG: hypothetical protein MK137_06130 [Rickettsiales bacterium]|nr:hypothetical protein [Rickettsiales bacterium]
MRKNISHHDEIMAMLLAQGDSTAHFKKLMMSNDQKKAEKSALEHSANKAEAAIGEVRNSIKDESADLEKTDKRHERRITKLISRLDKTDDTVTEYDKRAREIPDEQQRDIRKMLDYGLAITCFVLGCISLTASMLAMNILVRSAGIIAIIENPSLAWPFCVPLGLGAIALEFFKRTLTTHGAKRLYAKTIYAACAILMMAWIILAAKVFGSMADQGFDPAMLLEGSGDDPLMSLMTTVQLFLEFFIGCALFMTAGDLIGKHSKTREVPNEDYINLKKRIKELEVEHQKIKKDLRDKRARLSAIDPAVKLYIGEQMADYEKLRAQFT